MGLDSYRKNAEPILGRMVGPFMKFNPDTLTVLSFVLAVISALFLIISGRFIPWYFIILAFVALFLSTLFDAMDGFVARKKGTNSMYGDMLDHTFDRYSDFALITGFALSLQGNIFLGLLAVGGVFMSSYMGTQAQAVGLKRNYGGILGRADRLILMNIAIIVEFIYPFTLNFYIAITSINVMLIWFIIGGHVTAILRFRKTVKEMKQEKAVH